MDIVCSFQVVTGQTSRNAWLPTLTGTMFILTSFIVATWCYRYCIDDTFPTAQFFIKGFSAPYRQDRNRTDGGLLLFVREDVPSRILNPKSKTDIDSFR